MNWKNSLFGLAAVGFTSIIQAANVTLYGAADVGFAHTRETININGVKARNNTTTLDSGNNTASMWGLKGEETINDMTVGFTLESGFNLDDGVSTDSDGFNRESSLFVSSPYGTIYFGYLNSINADDGSIGFWGGAVSPFATGWGAIAGHEAVMVGSERRSNTVAYVSPAFGPLTLYMQYSGGNDDDSENTSQTDRYAAIGTLANLGDLQIAAVIDYTNRQSCDEDGRFPGKVRDVWTYNLGGSYSIGPVTIYAASQYYKNAGNVGSLTDAVADVLGLDTENASESSALRFSGYGLNLGISTEVAGGTLALSAGHAHGKSYLLDDKQGNFHITSTLLGYNYELSKRTGLYVALGHTQNKFNGGHKIKHKTTQAMFGLTHTF